MVQVADYNCSIVLFNQALEIYGKLPAEPNADLVKKALVQNSMEAAITCRPADLIAPEWDKMEKEAAENQVAVRSRDKGEMGSMNLADFVSMVVKEDAERVNIVQE